jgi:deazaflavin-dependent oxidoreductase (nitroreductase family)
MAERFLYLTTTGRRSGEPRHIEIWFVERGGKYYMVSERRGESNWVKNIKKTPEVSFSVGTRGDQGAEVPRTRGIGRAVREDEEPALVREVRALMDAKYRWSDGLVVEIAKAG